MITRGGYSNDYEGEYSNDYDVKVLNDYEGVGGSNDCNGRVIY